MRNQSIFSTVDEQEANPVRSSQPHTKNTADPQREILRKNYLLLDAAMDGNYGAAQRLISHKANPHYVFPEANDTAMSQAALKGHNNIVEICLQCPQSNAFSTNLSLIFAAQSGHTHIVKHLLEHGADVNISFSDYPAAIFQTIMHNHHATLQAIAAHPDVTINSSDAIFKSFLPITLAAKSNNLEMVKTLVQAGADLSKPNLDGESAASIARQNNNMSLLNYLNQTINCDNDVFKK